MKQNVQKMKGYTLIEMLVVIGVMSIVSVAAVNLMLTTLKGGTKDKAVQSVKLAGNTAVVQMENVLRSAVRMVDNGSGQTCEVGMGVLAFIDQESAAQSIRLEEGVIVANEVSITGRDVNTTNLVFDCYRGDDGMPRQVDVRFEMSVGDDRTDSQEALYSQVFTTGVGLRTNY